MLGLLYYGAAAFSGQIPDIPLDKTRLPSPAPARQSGPVATDPYHAATLVFTATRLGRDYRGNPLGTSSLQLYPPGGRCEVPPRIIADTQNVTADRPVVTLNIPADRPLVLASFWSARGAYCLAGDYGFTPVSGGVYRLTNIQDLRSGVCQLQLQRLSPEAGRYLQDNSLHRTGRTCAHRHLGM